MPKPIHIPEGFYYSKAEAAEAKGVYKATIQQWIDKGWLKSIKIGGAHLINADKLMAFQPPKPGPKNK